MCRVLSDSSLFYRCQVIALLNSCQNKFGLFISLPGEKKVWAMHRAKKSTLTNKLWLVLMGMKQKKFFFEKKVQKCCGDMLTNLLAIPPKVDFLALCIAHTFCLPGKLIKKSQLVLAIEEEY